VASLPLNTLNPLYARIFRESTVQRWLDAAPEQGEFNQREMAFLQTIVKEMDRQGIKMLLGSDGGTMYMPAGLSTHDELRLMQESGLSPQAVLQSATKNAAEALGIAEQTGAVEPGKIADLVITSESPLDDVSALANPLAVVKYGQWLGQSELDALLTSGQNPSSLYVSVGRLLEDLLSRL
jgi:imidazolonepropionase-like amidohydrolase